ncbi:MAG TPA: hypothetical protein VEG44_07170 [Candidatus Acidoferrales bacterium]|nr:hypothetical protein [Candidatus Acidoferrales bacterium]
MKGIFNGVKNSNEETSLDDLKHSRFDSSCSSYFLTPSHRVHSRAFEMASSMAFIHFRSRSLSICFITRAFLLRVVVERKNLFNEEIFLSLGFTLLPTSRLLTLSYALESRYLEVIYLLKHIREIALNSVKAL